MSDSNHQDDNLQADLEPQVSENDRDSNRGQLRKHESVTPKKIAILVGAIIGVLLVSWVLLRAISSPGLSNRVEALEQQAEVHEKSLAHVDAQINEIKQWRSLAESNQAQIHEQLDAQNNRITELEEDESTDQLRQRHEVLEIQVNSGLLEEAAHNEAIENLQQDIEKLKVTASAVQSSNRAAKARQAPRQPPRKSVTKTPVPEFEIAGVETRGGRAFLSIAPQGERSLKNLKMIDVGDQVDGWQLSSIGANAAVFRVNGQVVELPLP